MVRTIHSSRLFIVTTGTLLLLAATTLGAADYFIRENGDDQQAGTSRRHAWRTIERVNGVDLQPGDRVLFEGGKTFTGNLRLQAEDAGTSNAPVLIGSTGRRRAILLAGDATGITVESSGGVILENLVVTGSGRTRNSGHGILCDNRLSTGERLNGLQIRGVEVSGFGLFGILVTGERGGFSGVRIANCVMRDNLRGGMEVAGRLPYDSPEYAHADVQVTHCQAFDNSGDPNYLKNHSGSGIVLYQVDGGVIEHSDAWNNGAECRSKTGGGVGLWTCASRRVVIQHCESFANRTSGADGGGFDLDGGCIECVLQYNYSHDNDGPGLMVYTYPYASHADRGNIVRFNISENDSRRSRTYAGLWVRTDGPRMTGVEIYHNTVIVGPWCDQAAFIHANDVEANLRNNIFVGTGTALPLRVNQPHDRLRFEGNLYWRDDGPVEIAWDTQTLASLDGWRSRTGQEQIAGQSTGHFAPPRWSTHLKGVPPAARIGISSLRAFQPLPRSLTAIGGLDLPHRFGLETGGRDFFGSPLPADGRWPLGAAGAARTD